MKKLLNSTDSAAQRRTLNVSSPGLKKAEQHVEATLSKTRQKHETDGSAKQLPTLNYGEMIGGPVVANGVPHAKGTDWLIGAASNDGVAITLDGKSLSLEQVFAFLDRSSPLNLDLAGPVLANMQKTREGALVAAGSGTPVYGWTTALGPAKDVNLGQKKNKAGKGDETQAMILRSHAATVGDSLPTSVVRLAMLLRANTMASGALGVRPELVERFVKLLEAGITPEVPAQGSLGMGDLQPMAHLGLQVIGDVSKKGTGASEKMASEGVKPLPLESGEAIAIMSGSTIVTASMIDSVHRAEKLLGLFDAALAMFAEATRAEANNFNETAHTLRGHPEAGDTAATIRALTQGSTMSTKETRLAMGEEHDRVQDSVSVRNSTQQHGVLRFALQSAHTLIERELNAATSNPLVVEKPDQPGQYEFVMNGNWSGAYLGFGMSSLTIAVAALGELANQRMVRLMDPKWSFGLPMNLSSDLAGGDAGYIHVASAATFEVGQLRGRLMPVSGTSISVKGGQEDFNSLAANSASSLAACVDSLEKITAAELVVSLRALKLAMKQAAAANPGAKPGKGAAALVKALDQALGKFKGVPGTQAGTEYQGMLNLIQSGQLDTLLADGLKKAAA